MQCHLQSIFLITFSRHKTPILVVYLCVCVRACVCYEAQSFELD